jgi:hypothetical protein
MSETRELALAELSTLRSEVLAIRQIQTAIYTAALTILAAIAGVALAKKEGRIEMLLVLPFVLSGLGILLVETEIGIHNIGDYIRTDLARRLTTTGHAVTWETFIDSRRRERGYRYALLSAVSPALILLIPGIASLAVDYKQATAHLWPLFWGGAVAVAALIAAYMSFYLQTRAAKSRSAGS